MRNIFCCTILAIWHRGLLLFNESTTHSRPFFFQQFPKDSIFFSGNMSRIYILYECSQEEILMGPAGSSQIKVCTLYMLYYSHPLESTPACPMNNTSCSLNQITDQQQFIIIEHLSLSEGHTHYTVLGTSTLISYTLKTGMVIENRDLIQS